MHQVRGFHQLFFYAVAACIAASLVEAGDDSEKSSTSEKSFTSGAIGLSLGLAGGLIDNIGVCLQKLSHMRNVHSEKKYFQQKIWLVGITLYLCGNIMNALGLSLAPQSQFAVLGSFGLVTNVVTSRMILKETVNRHILVGTGVIIIGSLLAILSGNTGSRYRKPLQLNGLGHHFLSPGFLIYACLLLALLVTLRVAIRRFQKRMVSSFESIPIDLVVEEESSATNDIVELSGIGGIADNFVALMEEPLVENRRFQKHIWRAKGAFGKIGKFFVDEDRFCLLAFPFYAGAVASVTALLAKCVSELVKSQAAGGYSSFSKIQTYVMIVVTLSLGMHQIHWINLSLKNFDQLIVVPVFATTLETFSIIGGGIFFNELSTFNVAQAVTFPIAIIVTYSGVVIMTVGKHKRRADQMWQDGASAYLPERMDYGAESEEEGIVDGDVSQQSASKSSSAEESPADISYTMEICHPQPIKSLPEDQADADIIASEDPLHSQDHNDVNIPL